MKTSIFSRFMSFGCYSLAINFIVSATKATVVWSSVGYILIAAMWCVIASINLWEGE